MQVVNKDKDGNDNIDDILDNRIYNTKFNAKKIAMYFATSVFIYIKIFLLF